MIKKFRKVVTWNDELKDCGGLLGVWFFLILITLFFPLIYIFIRREVHWEEIKVAKGRSSE